MATINIQSVYARDAYQLAVANGFEGTLQEWLDSQIGATGPAGPEGPPGPTGATGPAGEAGPAGSDANVTEAAIVAALGSGSIPLAKLATDPLARANHTGTQPVETITGLQAALGGKMANTNAAVAAAIATDPGVIRDAIGTDNLAETARTPMEALRDTAVRSIPGLIAVWDFSKSNTVLNAGGTIALPGERVATIKDAMGGSYELTQPTDASRGVAKNGVLTPVSAMGYAVNNLPFNLRDGTLIFFTAPRSVANSSTSGPSWWDQNPTTEGGMALREYGGFLRNPVRFDLLRNEEGWGMLGFSMSATKTVTFNKSKSHNMTVSDVGTATITNLLMTEAGTLTQVPMLGIMCFNRGLTDAEISTLRAAFPAPHGKNLLLWGDSISKSSTLTNPNDGWAWRLAFEDEYNFYDGSNHGSLLGAYGALSGADHLSSGGVDDVFVLLAGTNDLSGDGTVATLKTEVTTTMTASPFRRICCTVLPRTAGFTGSTNSASFEAKRLEYNAWLRTQTFYDDLVDFDTVPGLADSTNLTYYSDGIHPTKVGSDLILAKIRAVIATP